MREREAGAICVRVCNGLPSAWAVDGDTVCEDEGEPALPDLDDHATLGCLLALVREEWGPESFAVRVRREQTGFDGWEFWIAGSDDGPVSSGATEAETLVSALEAAP
jgi:hypothetical protein